MLNWNRSNREIRLFFENEEQARSFLAYQHEISVFLEQQKVTRDQLDTVITKEDIAAFLFIPRDREKMETVLDSIYRFVRGLSDTEDELFLLALGSVSRAHYTQAYYDKEENRNSDELQDSLYKLMDMHRNLVMMMRQLEYSPNILNHAFVKVMRWVLRVAFRKMWK